MQRLGFFFSSCNSVLTVVGEPPEKDGRCYHWSSLRPRVDFPQIIECNCPPSVIEPLVLVKIKALLTTCFNKRNVTMGRYIYLGSQPLYLWVRDQMRGGQSVLVLWLYRTCREGDCDHILRLLVNNTETSLRTQIYSSYFSSLPRPSSCLTDSSLSPTPPWLRPCQIWNFQLYQQHIKFLENPSTVSERRRQKCLL